MREVTGNTNGLKPSQKRLLERIYRRRVPPRDVVGTELANFLCACSHDTGRQVGALIDRRGQIEHVVVGDAHKLFLPDVGRLRAAAGRFRGLRLVHTHLRGEALTNDDLTDLALLRLDLVAAIGVTPSGAAGTMYMAHLVPPREGAREPWMKLPAQPAHAVDLDFAELMRSLEAEFSRTVEGAAKTDGGQDRAILVSVIPSDARARRAHTAGRGKAAREADHIARVAELRELCRTAGVMVLDVVTQRATHAQKTLLGQGKLEQIVIRGMQLGAHMLIFDCDLSPGQARAISDLTELKVLDRTMLILDIFAQRAQSRDGKIQVELAQLKYTLPRLIEKNTMMSRLTGGIGGRGPGETKLEINRRRARERIDRLEKQIAELSKRRQVRRGQRTRREVPIVSIVGYTNGGKSTLLNTLTESETFASNLLFATLDTTSRRLRFPRERELVLTDTVGFIRDLPRELSRAFRATLEELADADLLLHVVDISDADYQDRMRAVGKILVELGLEKTPQILVFNKTDKLSPEEAHERASAHQAIPICALDRNTLVALTAAIESALWREGVGVPRPASGPEPAAVTAE